MKTDSDDLSQWQSEFRGQIRALRHWLKTMEMKLPPLEPTRISGGTAVGPIVPRGPRKARAEEPELCVPGQLRETQVVEALACAERLGCAGIWRAFKGCSDKAASSQPSAPGGLGSECRLERLVEFLNREPELRPLGKLFTPSLLVGRRLAFGSRRGGGRGCPGCERRGRGAERVGGVVTCCSPKIMGNLISRPSCLGQRSKRVRSDEDYLKECYQRRREWQRPEPQSETKQEEVIQDTVRVNSNGKERRREEEKEKENKEEEEEEEEVEEVDKAREEAVRTPVSDKPLRHSPASTLTSTSTLDNGWHSTPSPLKTSRNGTLTRRTVPPDLSRSPLAYPNKGSSAERRGSFQRRDSREGSPWSWKTLASREVTEVTEVTETTVTEIVEVTEYPSGERGGEPIVTRTVRVLNGVAEELSEGTRSALTLRDESTDSENFLQNLESLLTWVCEIEELTANQKPASSEVKVVKAQLQEQKLLMRLLADRRKSMEFTISEGPVLVEAHPGDEREEAKVKLSTLRQKWEALLQQAEQRKSSLELILPRTRFFQEGVDRLQHWLMSVEQGLAELRNAERLMLHLPEATERAKVQTPPVTTAFVEEIKVKNVELGDVQHSGRDLMEAISEDEAQQVQEKMDSLRMRCSVLSLSSVDVLQRLEQALEACNRCSSSQEDLHLWLGRIERELLGAAGAQTHPGDAALCASERQRLEQAVVKELAWFKSTALNLEKLKAISLDPKLIAEQLYEQKILAVEILQHRFNLEKMVKISEILLTYSDDGETGDLQNTIEALQEQCNSTTATNSHSVLHLEHAQSLLLQFSEGMAEVSPWLQETQALIGRLSLSTVSYEAFREQQDLLQGLRESVAEHRPLVARLCSVGKRLAELNPGQGEQFHRRAGEAEGQHRAIRDRVREVAGLLEESLPRYAQSLERLRGRLQAPVTLQGLAPRIQEQLRDNGHTLAELAKMEVGLAGIRTQADELLANTQAAGDDSIGKAGRRSAIAGCLKILDVALKFWSDVGDLTASLGDAQQASGAGHQRQSGSEARQRRSRNSSYFSSSAPSCRMSATCRGTSRSAHSGQLSWSREWLRHKEDFFVLPLGQQTRAVSLSIGYSAPLHLTGHAMQFGPLGLRCSEPSSVAGSRPNTKLILSLSGRHEI
ncbi:hypothetical protein CRUP_012985 [Coryphaenoides rupestris]|nr:hypothetical protein CRUP_012985 [Coryphaenoides rupestris]